MSYKDVQHAALDWTAGISPTSDDPSWAKFDYLKLRETLEAIVAAMEAAAQPVEPQSEWEPESTLRLVVSNDELENSKGSTLDEQEEPAA